MVVKTKPSQNTKPDTTPCNKAWLAAGERAEQQPASDKRHDQFADEADDERNALDLDASWPDRACVALIHGLLIAHRTRPRRTAQAATAATMTAR